MSGTRVVRVVSRLNVGGPAKQAILLSAGLEREGFSTLLVAGASEPGEGSLEGEARGAGVRLEILPAMRRPLSPVADARALARIVRILRRERPARLHTHTAKAGALGRAAAALARVPVRVHTFHGHTFRGYFGRVASRANLAAERLLARASTRLLAVCEKVHDDLVEMRVARPERVVLMRGGVELGPYLDLPAESRPEAGGPFRSEIGVPAEAPLLAAVGRLAPVKRIDLLLRAMARLPAEVHLALAGDGPERARLAALAGDLGLGGRVRFAGWRRDLAPVYAAADAVALSSASEGLPLSLVEAMASARAVAATAVGGVPELVVDGRTGLLVPPQDASALAAALAALLGDASLRREMGARGRARVRERYAGARLVRETAALYRALLNEGGVRRSPGAPPASPPGSPPSFPPP